MAQQIRLDDDVIELGEAVAEACGLNSKRVAIEAVMRLSAHYYIQRMTSGAASSPEPSPPAVPLSAIDALSALMSD